MPHRRSCSVILVMLSLMLVACGRGAQVDTIEPDAGPDAQNCDECRDGGVSENADAQIPPRCDDGARNGDESDIDCGGSCVIACQPGQVCGGPSDCASGVCMDEECQAPNCEDDQTNGDETGPDCGGSCAIACQPSQGCGGPSDCASGVCADEVCQPPSCEDGVQNGDESGTDCGGSCEDCPVSLPRSCMDIHDTGGTTDGEYLVDPDGPGGEEPRTVYCNMSLSGGGWTRSVLFVNSDLEDETGNNWLDPLVDDTMAGWCSNEILVALRSPGGAVVYSATGTRTNDWTYDHLTSTAPPSQQEDLGMHANKILLTNTDGDTDVLVLPGRSSNEYGCAGAMGNGYAVLIYANGATDQRYPKYMVLPYRLQQGDHQGQPRPFSTLGDQWTPAHELFGDGTAGSDTCSHSLPSFIGSLEIYVR
jgi:hypothetical protein